MVRRFVRFGLHAALPGIEGGVQGQCDRAEGIAFPYARKADGYGRVCALTLPPVGSGRGRLKRSTQVGIAGESDGVEGGVFNGLMPPDKKKNVGGIKWRSPQRWPLQ